MKNENIDLNIDKNELGEKIISLVYENDKISSIKEIQIAERIFQLEIDLFESEIRRAKIISKQNGNLSCNNSLIEEIATETILDKFSSLSESDRIEIIEEIFKNSFFE